MYSAWIRTSAMSKLPSAVQRRGASGVQTLRLRNTILLWRVERTHVHTLWHNRVQPCPRIAHYIAALASVTTASGAAHGSARMKPSLSLPHLSLPAAGRLWSVGWAGGLHKPKKNQSETMLVFCTKWHHATPHVVGHDRESAVLREETEFLLAWPKQGQRCCCWLLLTGGLG